MKFKTEVARGTLFRLRRHTLLALLAGAERGSSLAEFALMIPFLALMLLGIIDFGRAYYVAIEVTSAAHTGALYGTQNYTDTTGMENAATGDAPDVSGMTADATYGCECSDGSHVTVSCSTPPSCSSGTNVVNYISVTTTATYTPIIRWPGIPSPIVLSGAAKLRAGN